MNESDKVFYEKKLSKLPKNKLLELCDRLEITKCKSKNKTIIISKCK